MLAATNDWTSIFVWSGVLVAVILLGSALTTWIRHRTQDASEGEAIPDFTLSDVRRLHEQGKLSDEEFARIRDRILAEARARAAQPKEGKPGGRPQP